MNTLCTERQKKTWTELETKATPTNDYTQQVGRWEAKINLRGYMYFNFTHLP